MTEGVVISRWCHEVVCGHHLLGPRQGVLGRGLRGLGMWSRGAVPGAVHWGAKQGQLGGPFGAWLQRAEW